MGRGESVIVLTPAGVKKQIKVDNLAAMTGRDVTERAKNEIPGLNKNVRATFNGKTLENDIPLSKHGIIDKAVIHLVLKVHGG